MKKAHTSNNKKFIDMQVIKPRGRRYFRRRRHRWEHNIKINIGEEVFEGVNWIWLGTGTNV